MSEDTLQVVTVKLPAGIVARLDAVAQKAAATIINIEAPPPNRSAVIRSALAHGLRVLERKR